MRHRLWPDLGLRDGILELGRAAQACVSRAAQAAQSGWPDDPRDLRKSDKRPAELAAATIQLHGGIGFTWEHDTHLYYKNAIPQNALSGDPKARLHRLRALLASE